LQFDSSAGSIRNDALATFKDDAGNFVVNGFADGPGRQPLGKADFFSMLRLALLVPTVEFCHPLRMNRVWKALSF
jgi:hypothetical protein